MSVMTLNIFVLRKYRWIFELCLYFILFLLNLGVLSIETGGNRLPVSYKLMPATVLYSTIRFLFWYNAFSVFFFQFLVLIAFFES